MVSINKDEKNLSVKSPYHNDFVKRARELGGKWNHPVANAWNFSPRHEALVRQLCLDVYGTDGTPVDTVIVHVNLDKVSLYDELFVGPVQALKKWGRDSRPQLGVGCVVVQGGLHASGGSRNHPRITFDVGTVIEIPGVPAPFAEKLMAEEPEAYKIVE